MPATHPRKEDQVKSALKDWRTSDPQAYAEYAKLNSEKYAAPPKPHSRLDRRKDARRPRRGSSSGRSDWSWSEAEANKVEPVKTVVVADQDQDATFQKKRVVAYTDGACSGNPGPGGWGVLLMWGEVEKELCGGEDKTTNNRMEMMAAISALEALKRPVSIQIITDSQYVKNGIQQWMPNWKRNNWRTKSGAPVKNRDLWERLDRACSEHDVTWKWVRGHSGIAGNERADSLARSGTPSHNRKKRR